MDKTITILRRVKLAAFVILVFSIFLPFSSCTTNYDKAKFEDVHPENRPPLEMKTFADKESGEMVTKEVYVVKKTVWILKEPEYQNADFWLLVLSFFWPLLILILWGIQFFRTRLKFIRLSEFLFASLAALNIYFSASFLNTPEIGAYLAFIANMAIWGTVIAEGGLYFYRRKKQSGIPAG